MPSDEYRTQSEMVLWYMREFGSIDQIDALKDLGVMRLASRISDLRKQGHRIGRRMKKVTNRYGETCSVAEYTIEGEI